MPVHFFCCPAHAPTQGYYMASPSPCRRRRRRRKEARDWSALPGDILYAVFIRLGTREIMRGADKVCTAWHRAAAGEPALWRHVDLTLTMVPARSNRRWKAMARVAVDRAAGQCEAFWGPCDNDFLRYLVERATSLKSIRLYDRTQYIGLSLDQLHKLPLLEDVDISLKCYSDDTPQKLFESVCCACPRLKALRMSFRLNHTSDYYDSDLDLFCQEKYAEKYAIPVMGELNSLELLGYHLTAEGLTAILDSCPVLESLMAPESDYYDNYFIIDNMDEELRAKCAKLKQLIIPCVLNKVYHDLHLEEDGYKSESYENHSFQLVMCNGDDFSIGT